MNSSGARELGTGSRVSAGAGDSWLLEVVGVWRVGGR